MVQTVVARASENSRNSQGERKYYFGRPHSEKTQEPADDTELDLSMQEILRHGIFRRKSSRELTAAPDGGLNRALLSFLPRLGGRRPRQSQRRDFDAGNNLGNFMA